MIYRIFFKIKEFKRRVFAYFKNIIRFRRELSITYIDYDYNGVLALFKRALIILVNNLEKNGHEVDETLMPKIKDIHRVIELIDRQINKDFYEEAEKETGLKYDYKENSNDVWKISENNIKIIRKGYDISEKEWKEIWAIVSNGMRGWWE